MNRNRFPSNRQQFKKKKLPFAKKKIDDDQNKKIEQIEKKISKINAKLELKHVDTKFDQVLFTNNNTNSIVPINLLAQGTSEITRIGDVVNMTSVHIRGVIRRAPLEKANQVVRLILLYDRGTQGAKPTYANVFDNTTITGNGFFVFAPYNMDYFPERFKVLYDKSYSLDPRTPDGWVDAAGTITVSGYAPVERLVNKKIKISKKTVYGLGTTAAITSIASGSLMVILLGEEADSGSPYWFSGSTRVYYKDS